MASDLAKYFAQALLGQGVDQELAGANPYKPFESIADSVSQRLIQGAAKGEDDTKSLILGGLLSGIGGGLFSNLSEDYGDTQRSRLLSAAGDIYAGKDVERPTGIPSSVFNQLKTQAALGQMASLESDKDAAKALQSLKATKAIEAIANNPYQKDAILSGLGLSASDAAVGINGLPTTAALGGKTMDQYMREAGGFADVAKDAMKRDIEKPEKDSKEIDALRTEFQRSQIFTNYATAARAYPTFLKALADQQNPAADFEVVKMAVQMIEPGLAVNGGEAAAVQASASIPAEYKAYLSATLRDGSRIPDTIRSGLVALADRQYEGHKSVFERSRQGYEDIAKSKGINLSGKNIDVLGDLDTLVVTPKSVEAMIRSEAAAQGLPPELHEILVKQAKQESSFDQSKVSPKGAMGIMQLMPGTAKDLGVDPKDVKQNIKGGITYFKQQLDKFGNVADALRAYNAGPGRLEEIKAGKSQMPKETADYVEAILGLKAGNGITNEDALILQKLADRKKG